MMDIRDVPELPEALQIAATKGSIVPFVGAGVSRIAGCPGWDALASKYVEELIRLGKLDFSQAEQLSNQKLSARARLSLATIIGTGADVDFGALIHPNADLANESGRRLYSALGKIGTSFVTTNYDYWLDTIIDPVSSREDATSPPSHSGPASRNVIYEVKDISYAALLPNTVIHLHGSLRSPSTMVMTTSQYLQHYQNDRRGGHTENPILSFLYALFRNKTVLFVGYGLEELEILEYIILKRGTPGETLPPHFILQPFFSHEAQVAAYLTSYYQSMGIQLLPYLRDKNDYNQLQIVLETLANKIPAVTPLASQRFHEMKKMLDE